VNSFKVTSNTAGFARSFAFATTFKSVVLAGLNTDNGGTPFGFRADGAITSLSIANLKFMVDAGNPLVQTAVGKIFEANGQYEQASGAYRRALQTDPAYGPARLALIQTLANQGKAEEALAEAKKLAAEAATSPELQKLIGELLIRKGDQAAYAEAVPYLERATKGLPGNADAWAMLGRAYHYNRRFPEAADAYKKAVAITPDNVGLRTTLGLVLGQADKLEEGLAELTKVTSAPGYKDASGWVNLGWIYRNMNRAKESIAAYKKGLELDPKQEQAALGLGWAHQYTKDYDQAIAAYNQAIQIDPKEAAADANIGIAWCYFFKKDMTQARAFADKAAAAGRSVNQLKENIDRVEKAIAQGQQFSEAELDKARAEQQAYEERLKKLERASDGIQAKDPATRGRACGEIARVAGADAVRALVTLMQSDPNIDVRKACTNALGSLGPAARAALPNIDAMLRQPPYDPGINATAEELKMQMEDGDYKRALRDARAKIGR